MLMGIGSFKECFGLKAWSLTFCAWLAQCYGGGRCTEQAGTTIPIIVTQLFPFGKMPRSPAFCRSLVHLNSL